MIMYWKLFRKKQAWKGGQNLSPKRTVYISIYVLEKVRKVY